MSLDKDKLQEEMSILPLSPISMTIAAASTSTAAATSSLSAGTGSYSMSNSSTSTTNPVFLTKVISKAVNDVLQSSSPSSS